MSGRLATLEYNLALLQDCIRRDPASYKDEFLEQYRHFQHTLQLFRLQPNLDPDRLVELINFHSHVAHCYRGETKTLADDLIDLLSRNNNVDALHSSIRLSSVKALALLRNRNLASPFGCLKLFFELSKCRDKELRKFLFTSTVQYVKLLNTKHRDAKLNGQLQNFILSQLQTAHSSKVVARMALLLLIDLYRRRIWMDAKTVNAIAMGGCLSSVTKLSATACKFFLGKELDDKEDGSDNDDDDDEENHKSSTTRSLKDIMVGYKAGKKTKSRQRAMARAKQAIEKSEKTKKNKGVSKDAGVAALRLLYDPQGFAERLFRKLEQKSKTERFEFRILIMALLARVIGLHKVQVLNFYTFLLRFLQPRQQDVTKILLFAAQASHDMVPPDAVEMLVKTIVDNFVSDRNSSEAMTVGLNACREILTNCPLAIDEDLLQDLVEYKKYRNKNVSMAARSLIQLFRRTNPALLHKRDRGRPTEADKEFVPVKTYGESRAVSFIPGAEVLATRTKGGNEEVNTEEGEGEEDEDGWVSDDQASEDDDDDGSEFEEIEEGDIDLDVDEDEQVESGDNDDDDQNGEDEANSNNGITSTEKSIGDNHQQPPVDSVAQASAISADRIFTQEEFRRIYKHQLKKQLEPFRKRKSETESKHQMKKRRKKRLPAPPPVVDQPETKSDDDEVDDGASDGGSNDEDEEEERGDLPRLADIEHLHKRPKMDREQRMATVKAGREGREKFGRPKNKGAHVGRTNKSLSRNKAFGMVRRKEAKKMKRRSFREKQQALRKYLVNQKKMK